MTETQNLRQSVTYNVIKNLSHSTLSKWDACHKDGRNDIDSLLLVADMWDTTVLNYLPKKQNIPNNLVGT